MMDFIGKLVGPVAGILDKVVEDKDQKAKLAHEIATMAERHAQELAKGQIEINKAEAQSRNIFIAGWRPFVGWSCGLALFWHFLGLPITLFVTGWLGVEHPPLPQFDMDSLMTVLLGMLGLGGLRTFEKVKQVAK
jgi:phenylpyruvate tautomerase PptA (4-oxalocrotonate tautomerase family)